MTGNLFISGSPDQTIWQLTGTQGNNWQQAQAPINQTKSYQVVFEGRRGQSYTGDIAIDDVSFTASTCGGKLKYFQTRMQTFENGGCDFRYVTHGGMQKLGVLTVSSEKLDDFEIICLARRVR